MFSNRISRLTALSTALLLSPLQTNAFAQNSRPPQQATISLPSLLQEMTDVESIARWPQATYTNREASSYDRRTVSPNAPGWWANDDFTQFIRTEEKDGRQERVMLDADGPGALVRFWLTAGSPKEGKIRIYLDGATEPALVFNAFDLEAGSLKLPPALLYRHDSYSPSAGGNTLYLPIPYAKHCKVTWEEGSRQSQRYYQINYRTYPTGTPVKTWMQQQYTEASPLIESAARALATPPQTIAGRLTSLNKKLTPNETSVIGLPSGPHAVRTLELLLDAGNLPPAELERALRSVIIQLTFDGERTVWCPATDFFGTGVGINELRNFYQTVGRDGTMRCRWVMPYQRQANISLLNLGKVPVMATLHATTAPWKWDARSMHFHANWHFQSGLKAITIPEVLTNTKIRDWNFIDIKGRGVYAGDSLSLFNPVATWYGEGDEKIFVDGEAFPSHMGTGTEDYYGYSYAPRPVFQTPFVNHTRIDSPSTQGYNVMSRVRTLDAIPFQRSLKFDIETISWAPTTLTYGATTYWYGFPGATTNRTPQPQQATLPVQTLAEALTPRKLKPSAIEAESLTVVNRSPNYNLAPQEMSPWDASRWSSGKQLLGKETKIGDFAELEIPAPDNRPRQIILQATQAPDYGILRFTVNGQPSTATFNGYSPDVQPGIPLKLGVFTPRDGKFQIRIEVTASDPKTTESGALFGLDYFELTPP